ncbi:hypothetical protein PUR49_36915 [Streptomyces sp. BE147]|uniref:hypothetical protein n=1 Tax=Streptomyces sp. BE147 TaxID=3002524 RepID=UPI002E7919A8|nr:hypothetical protein [Streptomyces sp. BE147]MEE1742060.1 hypothetical protein [Streptomyces sp. BE147]
MRTLMGRIGTLRRTAATALACTAVACTALAGGGAGTAAAATVREAPSPRSPFPSPPTEPSRLPSSVDGGAWRSGHVQGMAIDRRKGFMYFSFTDLLVKTDLGGRPVGSVTGFTGHLGDLDFNARDGRVYGSLEYKAAKSFYIAILDADRITRMGMDAQSTGVVSTVHLKEVVRDFTADMNGDGVFDGDTGNTPDHRYGCSGIDGVAFGPEFGRKHGKQRLTVAYGVYANTGRADNDHQVLLQYDIGRWKKYERPLSEAAPHTSGPTRVDGKYFAYTGNTTYGVQNLEFDGHSGNWLMAAYKGTKPGFPNYTLFALDGSKKPVRGVVRGQREPERGLLLPLLRAGLHDAPTGTYGWPAPGQYGQYGLVSLDDGRFYVARGGTVQDGGVTKQTARAELNTWTGRTPSPFGPVAPAV